MSIKFGVCCYSGSTMHCFMLSLFFFLTSECFMLSSFLFMTFEFVQCTNVIKYQISLDVTEGCRLHLIFFFGLCVHFNFFFPHNENNLFKLILYLVPIPLSAVGVHEDCIQVSNG